MLLRGEAFGFHILNVIGECLLHLVMEVCIFFDELGREAVEQTQQVMCDQDLSVATQPRANAYGGHGNFQRDQFGKPRRDRFQHDAEAARFLQDERVFDKSFRSNGSFALGAESTELIDGLRRQSKKSRLWTCFVLLVSFL